MSERFEPEISTSSEDDEGYEVRLFYPELDGEEWTQELVENLQETARELHEKMTGDSSSIAFAVLSELFPGESETNIHFRYVKYLTMMSALMLGRVHDLKQGIPPKEFKTFASALIKKSRS